MMQASEIRDEKTLQAWLAARPETTQQRDAVIIAHRAAMRVLPLFVQELNEGWAQKHGLTALPVLRPNLTSGATVGNPAPEVKKAAVFAATAAAAATTRSATTRSAAATRSATTADSAAFAAAFAATAADSAFAATTADSAFAAAAWTQIQSDAAKLETSANPEQSALWPDAPEALQQAWATARAWLTVHPGHDFWIRWYEAALAGRPLTGDWETHDELLTDIALIPDEDWEKGAEHIAALIAEIEARHRLLAETRRLKTELAPMVTAAAAAPIGHNHPPEPLDDAPLPQQLTIIWAMLDNAELELSKPKPDKSVLRKIGTSLKNAAIAIARYCGLKADKALDKAVETLGATVGKGTAAAIVAKLAGLDDAVLALANAIKTFAGP
ncbi:hypothetical protein LPB142_11410 [Rhodobacter xanthinilyticus]|uniref:Uncharacterized protein n=1 Tax=Rhodobacter xanthinilyticus TaxID=1850250 RepID=A0A1D9MDC2_9RHOB|nr:hypothetical protein [Rhodobacter xanthinilyticus]AOZ69852.1 hypothetical protein LPB142_11410 [Rhodobacter xanthinilyticus]